MSRISHASQAEIIRPIHKIFYQSQSPQDEAIRLSQRIGIGAEGEVYEIQDRSDLAAKIYHEPPPPEKAEKLVALSRLGNERLFKLSAWPVDVLRESPAGRIAGFVMKKISQAEEVHALHSPKSRLQKFPEASWAFLIYVAANVARAVAAIHEHGFVIGDVNPKNILVTRKATVYLLDVDSFQVSADGKTYRCEGGFPEYTPPELQGVAFREVDRTREHDCFGLAVAIFQLLFMGRHPFSGRFLGAGEMPLERAIRESRFAYGADAEVRKMRQPPGTLALDSLPPRLVELFRRAFLSMNRPQPREWIEPLDALTKSLKKCVLHSGHYYYRELRDCPWCGIESHARVRLFNFLLHGADSQRGHFRLDDIWKEIVSVETPGTSLIPGDKMLKAPEPSAEVAGFVRNRRKRFIISLLVSAAAGLLIALFIDFPLAFFLLILAGLAARVIAKAGLTGPSQPQSLFQNQQTTPNDPFVRGIWSLRRDADHKVRQIEEKLEKEASDKGFIARLNDLQNRKETYENLAQIRRFRLQQLEAEARKTQLNEFLDQFEINDAEIKGVILPIKTALLLHGVETAADVIEDAIEEVKRIPSVGRSQAERLLEWRRDLERKFVFDPARGVSPEARVKTEREVDALRFRLEYELSGGAHYLRRAKQEIETGRQKLQPALAQARQELAQAEKDLKVAGKRNSFALILATLIIAFFIGCASPPYLEWLILNYIVERPVLNSGGQPPPAVPQNREALAEQEKPQEALKLYRQGVNLSREEKFEEAVKIFLEAVEIDSKLNGAYEELGYALYRLKRFEESMEASKAAITLHNDFGPHYNLGLVYLARENWEDAETAFGDAVAYRNKDSWAEAHTFAYYYLGLSKAQLGGAEQAIEALENKLKYAPKLTVERLELGSLYLWLEKQEAARAQYEILKNGDPALAEELMKLMKKHGRRQTSDEYFPVPHFPVDKTPNRKMWDRKIFALPV